MRTSAKMNSFIFLLLLGGCQWGAVQSLSDQRLCADPKCQKVISQGITTVSYPRGAPGMVSFKINTSVRILSKSAGSDPSLWGIDVGGRVGYAPKQMIQEQKIYVKDADLMVVPVELAAPITLNGSDSGTPETPAATAPLPATPAALPATVTTESGAALPSASPVQASKVQTIDGTEIPEMEPHTIATPVPTVTPSTQVPTMAVQKEDVYVDDLDDYGDEWEEVDMDDEVDMEEEELLRKNDSREGVAAPELAATAETARPISDTNSATEVPVKVGVTATPSPATVVVEEETVKAAPTVVPAVDEPKASTAVPEINESASVELNATMDAGRATEEAPLLPTKSEEGAAGNITEAAPATPPSLAAEEVTPSVETVEPVIKLAETHEEEALPPREEALPHTTQSPLPMLPTTMPLFRQQRPQKPAQPEAPEEPAVAYFDNQIVDPNEFYRQQQMAAEQQQRAQPSPQVAQQRQEEVPQMPHQEELTTPTPHPAQHEEKATTPTPHVVHQHEAETTPTPLVVHQHEAETAPPPLHLVLQHEEAEYAKRPLVAQYEEQMTSPSPLLPQYQEEMTPPPQLVQQQGQTIPPPQLVQQQEEITPPPPQLVGDQKRNIPPPEVVQHHDPYSAPSPNVAQHEEPVMQPLPQLVQPHEELTTPTPHLRYDEAKSEEVLGSHQGSEEVENDRGVGSVEVLTPFGQLPPHDHLHHHHHPEIPQPTVVPQEAATPEETHDHRPQHQEALPTPAAVPPEQPTEKPPGGLFATILDAVNTFPAMLKKDPPQEAPSEAALPVERTAEEIPVHKSLFERDAVEGHCPRVERHYDFADWTLDATVDSFAALLSERRDFLACLALGCVSSLVFIFGYYCLWNGSREGELLARLNHLERCLLVTHKENGILKHDLTETRSKLSSIEDNSFGSNDLAKDLRQQLEAARAQNEALTQQITTLEKELENAAEAGLELNRIVTDLLNHQSGDENIITSVENLQKQLNEQQTTIVEINATLAEKSRENSELQLLLAEQGVRLEGAVASLQQDNDELEAEKSALQTRLEELKADCAVDISKALEGKSLEITRLQGELLEAQHQTAEEHQRLQASAAKVESLEECLRSLQKDPSVNLAELWKVADVRAETLDLQKRLHSLKDRLDRETDGHRLAEEQLQAATADAERLKQCFHQSEKDKLEAQTRLEVLSNYFKEKETQLQRELSLKEVMWLQQQGETTSTVDRLAALQEEIQSLKSQNDALRAEIEAQIAAHKAQTGTLENRAHETWLTACKAERRCEEARMEAAALRRKLTAIAGDANRLPNATGDGKMGGDLANAPSPLLLEPLSSPLLGRMPPSPFLPPPPFMGPPPPFLGMPPPPPFGPPGEMRPAPLGRIMSPPPPPQHLRPGRYSPDRRPDYDDYEDDDDFDMDDRDSLDRHPRRGRRRSGGGDSHNWRRGDYSPYARSRSGSRSPPPPEDSRYSYVNDRDLMSTYDTETDFSPPSSPPERRPRRGSRAGSYRNYSPTPPNASTPLSDGGGGGGNGAGKMKSTSSAVAAANKGTVRSSGSDLSFDSPHGKRSGGRDDGGDAAMTAV